MQMSEFLPPTQQQGSCLVEWAAFGGRSTAPLSPALKTAHATRMAHAPP